MAHQPNGDNRDSSQVLKESYDPSLNRIRVDAIITDGTDAVVVNTDGSLNVKLADTALTLSADSTIGTIESGTVDTAYNEITSVPMNVETQIVSYIATNDTRLKIIEVSGTNIAAFTVYVNGTPIHKKRTFFGNLDNNFQFSKGYHLLLGDIVSITALHTQASVGDFNGFILVLIDS